MTTDTEKRILIHLLQEGNDAPKNIGENIDRSPEYVSDRLSELSSEGLLVESKGSGVWRLTPEGAELARAYLRDNK
mgnify:CR=1 FL=1